MEKEKTLVWLDDIRNPRKGWAYNFSPIGVNCNIVWVKSYKEFVEEITRNGIPDAVCFDHDLGGLKDGYDCCKFLVSTCLEMGVDIPKYAIQSANVVGAENIKRLMDNYHKNYLKNK